MQLLEYPYLSGKRWHWHLVLIKEWLRTVEAKPTSRKYTKWMRARKIFDRPFINFMELFIGIERGEKKAPILGDVAVELLEEMGKSESAATEAEKRLVDHSRKMGRSRGRELPPPPPGGRPAQAQAGGPTYAPPSADTDPFLKALLERFTELNPYLTLFVHKEIGEDFLGATEIFRRIGSNDYLGKRPPSMPGFERWVQWMEWLGGLKKVGFRHKFTQAGSDVGAYLAGQPVEELLVDDDPPEPEPEPEPEPVPDPESTVESQRLPDLIGEDDDEDEEELDLPPSAEPAADATPYWKSEAKTQTYDDRTTKGFDDDASERTTKGFDDSDRETRPYEDASEKVTKGYDDSDEQASLSEVASSEAQTRAFATEGGITHRSSETVADPDAVTVDEDDPIDPAMAETVVDADEDEVDTQSWEEVHGRPKKRVFEARPNMAPDLSNGVSREALRMAASWWLDRPRRKKTLSESGVSTRPHPSGKPVALFKLLGLATLLEAAGPPSAAKALFRALDKKRVFEALLVDGAPLERALEVAWRERAPAYLQERLVHLLRYRHGLERLPLDRLWKGSAQAVARELRKTVTGDTLGPGLIFVLRELTAGGGGPQGGLEDVSWLPSLLED